MKRMVVNHSVKENSRKLNPIFAESDLKNKENIDEPDWNRDL